jgi:hypothetical protein
MEFQLPPRILNSQGEKRRVGFELEFGGLDLLEAAKILERMFDGEIERDSEFVMRVATDMGEFELKADSTFLKEKRYKKYLSLLGISSLDPLAENAESMIAKLAGSLIPFEIVTPPFDIDRLAPVEMIRSELYRHSAKGTRSGLFTAFGMQFNPELPDFESETILNYLRSFFLLYDWLFEESDIPVIRRVTPFINEFPEDYIRLILEPSYNPGLRRLMTDYLEYNPTRNRPLDLLPLFAYLDEALVFSFSVEKQLVKPRPTFHYRLPNSEVDDPHWEIAAEWNKWVEIERLAFDDARLSRMTEDFFKIRQGSMLFAHSKWARKTRRWLNA